MAQTDMDKLLDRFIKNKTSAEETKKIDAWLEVKKSDDSGALELTAEDEELLYLKIINPAISADEIREFRPLPPRGIFQSTILRIAAGLIVVAAAVWIIRPSLFRPDTHVTTAQQATEKIILPDQSIIWLHKDSKLTWYSSGENIRQVQLEGEGLFEVAKDAAHPFTVSYHGMTATVLGTSFSLKTATENMELSVLTGKVKLSSATDVRGIEVLPNEKIVYNGSGNGALKAVITPEEAGALATGTEYNMNFSNVAIAEVFARMEKKFDVKITVADEAIRRCSITADFTDRSLENTLLLISEIVSMKYKINGKSISISGSGCQ
jgi:transmembrane sensor